MNLRPAHNLTTKLLAFLVIFLTVVSLCPSVAQAVAPANIITYQGRLLNDNGTPVADASLNMEFRFYDSLAGGTCLWSNSSATCADSVARAVSLTDGLFSENLGDTVDTYAAIADSVFSNDSSVYLEVEIAGETLTPRKRITAAAYAINSQTLDGLDSTAFLQSVDISDNTNLVAGTNITLDGDTLNVDDAFLMNNGDTGTGAYIFTSDIDLTLETSENLTITNSTATAEVVDLTATAVGNDAAEINFTLDNDGDVDTLAALDLEITTAATGDADNLYGLQVNLTNAAVANVTETALMISGAWENIIDAPEFDVSGATGSITINDGGNAGQVSIEGTILDINSLDFVGTGAINTNDENLNIYTEDGLFEVDSGGVTLYSLDQTQWLALADGVTINTNGVEITSTENFVVDTTDGAIELNSSEAAINIGNDAVAQAISIGTGSAARTMAIGNNNNGASLALTGGDEWSMAATGLLTFSPSAALAIAIEASDEQIATALNVGANDIVGSTGLINYTNFDVNGSTGKTDWVMGAAGQLTIDAFTTDNTTTDGVLKLIVDTSTTGNNGFYFDYQAVDDDAADTLYASNLKVTIDDDTTNTDTVYGQYINFIQNDITGLAGAGTGIGLAVINNDDGAGLMNTGILIENQQATDIDLINGLLIQATTEGSLPYAINVSDDQITNALNIGSNIILGTAGVIDFSEFDVAGDTGSITINDGGNAGQISVEGTILDIDSLTFVGTGAVNTNNNDFDINTGTGTTEIHSNGINLYSSGDAQWFLLGDGIDVSTNAIEIISAENISLTASNNAVSAITLDGNNAAGDGVTIEANTGGVDVNLTATGPMSIDGDLVVIGGAADGSTATGDGDLYVVGDFEVGGTTAIDGAMTFSSDVDMTFAVTENLTITNSTATAEVVDLTVTAVGNDAAEINFTLGNDGDIDTLAALDLEITTAATGDADNLYGLQVNLTNAAVANVTETALMISGAWENIIDAPEFNVSGTTGSITINDGGNAGQISVEGTILDINSLDFVGTGAITTNNGAFDINSGTGLIEVDSDTGINLYSLNRTQWISLGDGIDVSANGIEMTSTQNLSLTASNGAVSAITLDGNNAAGDGVTIEANTGGVDVNLTATGPMSIDGDLVVIGGATDGNLATNDGDLYVVGDFEVDTNSRFDGSVDFGDAATDTISATGVVDTDLTFIKEVARTIKVADSTTAATVGASLTIQGGAGTAGAANNGGNLILNGGLTGVGGTNGIVQIGLANTSAVAITPNTSVTGTFDVDGATTLDQVTIATADGAFAVSGTNSITLDATGTNINLGSTAAAQINIGQQAADNDINIGEINDNVAIISDSWSITDAGAATFTSDVDLTFGTTENLNINYTTAVDDTINVLNLTLTDNAGASTGTLYLASLDNATNGANTGAPDALLNLDNSNLVEAVAAALNIQSEAGGLTYGIDLDNATINTADIRLENSDTISNNVGGTIAVSGDFTVTGGDITVSGEASTFTIIDNTASAFVLESVTDGLDYIAITTTNDSETMVLGQSGGTMDSLSVYTDGTGTAEVALPAGSIDSTELLDLTVASGDIADDTIDFDKMVDSLSLDSATAITGAAGETFQLTRTLTNATTENGMYITVTASDTTNNTTAQYGLLLDNAAAAEALDGVLVLQNTDADDAVAAGVLFAAGGAGTDFTYGIDLDATNIGTADIRLENSDTISNAADGSITLTGVDGTNNAGIVFDLDGATTATPTLYASATDAIDINDSLLIGVDGNTADSMTDTDFTVSGGNDLYVSDKLGIKGEAFFDNNIYLSDTVQMFLGDGSDATIGWVGGSDNLLFDNINATGSTIFQLGTDTTATDFQILNNTGNSIMKVDGAGTTTFSGTSPLVFEGTLPDDEFETTFVITNPTADNLITFKNASGTVAFTSDLGGADLWEVGTYGTYEDDAVVIIGADADFPYLDGVDGDLFVADELEVAGNIYLDAGVFYINGYFDVDIDDDLGVASISNSAAFLNGALTLSATTLSGGGGVNTLEVSLVQSTATNIEDNAGINIDLIGNDVDGDVLGLIITAEDTANATTGTYEAGIKIENMEGTTTGTMIDGVIVYARVEGNTIDAFDASDTEINNALNIGLNNIVGNNFNVNGNTGKTDWIMAAAGQLTIDAVATGNTTTTGVIDLNVGASATGNIGLNIDYTTLNDTVDDTLYAQYINTNIVVDSGNNDTVYGLYIATTIGDTGATAYGIQVAAPSADGNETQGINIGSGWDDAINVNSGKFLVETTGVTSVNFNTLATTNGVCHSGADLDAASDDTRILVACSDAPGDYAEWYETESDVVYADIVSTSTANITYQSTQVDPFTGMLISGTVEKTLPVLKKAESSDSGKFLAVVSTSPIQTIGSDLKDQATHPMPVALTGRVPVHVTNEGGSIAVGDPITTSSTAGYGMKATEPGMIIGYALNNFSDTSGEVMMFVHSGWYAGNVISTDGSATVVSDTLVLNSLDSASETTPGVASQIFALRGSSWNGSSADALDMKIQTQVTDSDNYRLSIKNTTDSEIAYITNEGTMTLAGDLIVTGKFYPSDRGVAQTSKYIYYDGSAGPGGDMMRTNASGWSTGSYDFAEMFPSDEPLEAGDVVAFTGANENVGRTSETYSSKIAGVVSTRPGFLAGENKAGQFPVALAGRVPTKVNLENGNIAVGDPLTTSSVSGYAMKATQNSMIVGYALEPYTGTEGDEKIIVFVNVGYFDGQPPESIPGIENTASLLSSNLSSLNLEGGLYMGGNDISNIGRLIGLGERWSIEADGTIKTESTIKTVINSYQNEKVETTAITSSGGVFITLVGTAELQNGEAIVTFEEIDPNFNDITSTTAPIRVIVTPSGPVSLYVSEKNNNGFMIKQIGGSNSGISVDWMVTAYRKDYEPDVIPSLLTPPQEAQTGEGEITETVTLEEVIETPTPPEDTTEEVIDEPEVVEEPAASPIEISDPTTEDDGGVEPEPSSVEQVSIDSSTQTGG